MPLHDSEKEALIFKKYLNATADKIWGALTDPEAMRQWYFPMLPGFKPEIGFEVRFDVVHPESGKTYPHLWTITEAKAGKRLAYDWKYVGYPGLGNVSFLLEQEGNLTLLTLEFKVLRTFNPEKYPELSTANYTEGWKQILKSLQEFIKK